jgi:hypothetical protein
METTIRPTITHRVRDFLEREGIELLPWSGLDDTYAALYEVLNRRRDDPAFWGPLAELLREVVAAASDAGARLPAPGAELLASWDIDDLVRDLRGALPGREAGPGALGRFTAGLSTAVLGGFLLLGMAATGCSDEEVTALRPEPEAARAALDAAPASNVAADAAPAPPECGLEPSSVLRSTIDRSSLADADKRDLCACLSSVGPSWSNGLTALFSTGTPEQIATALERIAELCSQEAADLDGEFSANVDPAFHPGPPAGPAVAGSPAGEQPAAAPAPAKQARRRRVREMFSPAVAYRGVSFWTK